MISISPPEDLSNALNRWLNSQATQQHPLNIFFNLSRFESLLRDLAESFPSNSLHAIAVKANPLVQILKKLNNLNFGAEVASIGELHLAKTAGFPGERILFDSPVKTVDELRYAAEEKIRINFDNLSELNRAATSIDPLQLRQLSCGVRVNPQTAVGTNQQTLTAGPFSKFGVGLKDSSLELTKAYQRNEFLNTIHVHVGSQTCTMEQLVSSIKVVIDFALELNAACGRRQIINIDIGGGLPSPYRKDENVVSFKEYSTALKSACPKLFDGTFLIFTEFGRHIHSGCGWGVSKVEAIKSQAGIRTVLTHFGADLFIRECYRPQDWFHEIYVCNPDGTLKTGEKIPQTIAGPLCFSGDIIAHQRPLPKIEEGDLLIISDIGAYSFSMWSRYNSRPFPQVLGYHETIPHFEILKERETLDQIVNFWR